MSSLAVVMRRVVLIVMLAAAGGAAWAWWRDRADPAVATDPPSWPPLEPSQDPAPSTGAPSTDTPGAAAATDAGDQLWVAADAEGACPLTHPIKAKESSGIYHVEDGRMYARTKADRCYATADAAEQDGYRRSKT
ncbi:MAG: hypothetical protein AAGA42_22300 [Actinomycetota bacterium]